MNEFGVCEKQNEIIKLQSDIIDDLYAQLMQYVSIEEEEQELRMMQKAVNLQKEVQNSWE